MLESKIRSSIPQMNRYPEIPGVKALFHSVRDIALIIDKTFQAGYGFLKAGTVMAINLSAAGALGQLVPYVPISTGVTLGGVSAIGIAPMVVNGSSGHVYVSLEDSYKFIVGDELYFDNDSDEGPVDCGVITAIDRTTSTLYADISCGAYTATNATVVKKAYVHATTGVSGEYTTAAYILDADLDTGVGEEAAGAIGSVVVSNAILYKNSLINLTDAAITSLGVVDGRFFILK